MSSFARSFAAQRFEHPNDATASTRVFPMPIPYPEVFEKRKETSSARQASKQIIVMLVIVLNYLYLKPLPQQAEECSQLSFTKAEADQGAVGRSQKARKLR